MSFYSVYRSRVMCPICCTEEEVWVETNGIKPKSELFCLNCATVYDAEENIFSILELESNVTSTSNISSHLSITH